MWGDRFTFLVIDFSQKHGEASISCYGSQLWNLPGDLRAAGRVSNFKVKLKTSLFSEALLSLNICIYLHAGGDMFLRLSGNTLGFPLKS